MKAYIIRIYDEKSIEYSETAAESCRKLGIEYEFFQGVQGFSGYDALRMVGIPIVGVNFLQEGSDPAWNATASHFLLWKLIAERGEPAIVLEHDAIMLHRPLEPIPEHTLVCLGYKITDPSSYDHEKAGRPERYVRIWRHEGAHAYAITAKTAAEMLRELTTRHLLGGAVDNIFFIKDSKTNSSLVPLVVSDPIAALGWIRKSTIWDESDVPNKSYTDKTLLPSFLDNWNRD